MGKKRKVNKKKRIQRIRRKGKSQQIKMLKRRMKKITRGRGEDKWTARKEWMHKFLS